MERLKVVSSPLPFSNLQEKKTIECGGTLLEIVDAVIPERFGNSVGAIVFINGHKINQKYWGRVRPKANTLINIRVVPQGGGGGGKNPLSTILTLALFVAAPYIAGQLAFASLGGVIGGGTYTAVTVGQQIGFAAIRAGVTVVGMMAINALAPPPKQRTSVAESPSLLIEGARNRFNPYGSVPVYLGRNRVFPDQCARSFTETVGSNQYVRQLFMLGFGDQVQIESPKIGDTPLSNFRNVDTETFLTGNLNSGGRLWQNSVNQESHNILLSNAVGWVRRTLPPNSDAVVIDFTFPAGLNSRDSKGGRNSSRVQLRVEYRRIGTPDWIGALEYRTIPAQTFTNILNPAWTTGNVLFWLDRTSGVLKNTIASGTTNNVNMPNAILLSQVTFTTTYVGFLNTPLRHYTITDLRNPALFGNVIESSTDFITTRDNNSITISSGGWSADPLNISSNSAELFIRSHRIQFPESGDYEIRVRRITGDRSSERETDQVYLTSTKAYAFQRPVSATNLNGYAIRMQATEQLNGAVDEFNLIVSSIVPDYSPWLGNWSVSRVSRNPASLYLYVLRGGANAKPVPDSQIDFEKLTEWWLYCAERNYTCDLPIDYNTSVQDTLQLIASSGSATPDLIDGKRSVVIDRAGKDIVQIVTPRNSWGYSGEKIYPKLPHAFRVTFRNEQKGYLSDERVVYTEGYNVNNARLFEELQLPWCTNPDLAFRSGRRYLATALLRPETHTFTMDLENLVMTRGDRILLQHDIPLVGIGNGRIKDIIIDSSGSVSSIVLDDTITFPQDGLFFVRIRFDDGSILYREVIATIGDTHVLTFSQPLSSVDVPKLGDLCYVTTAGGELDLIVKSIEPQNDLTARITCLNYSPEIFDAETGVIPPFDSKITVPLVFLAPNPPILLGSQSDETVMIRNIDGTFTSQAVFTLENTNENTVSVDVVYKAAGDTEWLKPKILSESPNSVAITDLEDGRRYDIWIRYKRQGGQYSTPLQINDYLFVGNSLPPSDVTNFEIEVTGQTAIFTWDKNEDIDLSHYEIRFTSSQTGAAWVTSQVLEQFVYENRIALIAQSGTYLIKAVDFAGNYSVNETVIVTTGIEGVLNAVAILQEDPDFSGQKINTEVYNGGLTLLNLVPDLTIPSSQYLQDLFPSTVFDLDARMVESYPGSGNTWFNLCSDPADGSAQSSYDFTNNSPSTLVFNGTAGSPDAFWETNRVTPNAADRFQIPVSSQTDFLKRLSRSDNLDSRPFTVALSFRNADTISNFAASSIMIGANSGLNVANSIRLITTMAGDVRLAMAGNDINDNFITTNQRMEPSQDYVYIISMDKDGNFSSWLNGVKVEGSRIIPESTADTNSPFVLFRQIPPNAQIYAASTFNSFFDDEEALALQQFYRGRPYVDYGKGYYYFDNDIDLTDVFTSYLSAEFVVGAIFKNNIFRYDDIFQIDNIFGDGENNIFQMDDIFDINDIFGIESDSWDAILEMRTTNDDPSDLNAVWTDWFELTAGSHEFRAAQFRVYLESDDPGVTPIVLRLSVSVDMPDRIERGDDLTVPIDGVTITFNPSFKDVPALSILTQNGDAGDEIQFVSKTENGFEFRVYNRVSMSFVERTYDFIASGYGRVIQQ